MVDNTLNDELRVMVKSLTTDGTLGNGALAGYKFQQIANAKAPIYYWGQHADKGKS